MALGDLGERRADDVVAEVAGVLDDALLLEDVDARHGRRAGQRMTGVREPALVRLGGERLGDPLADDHATERDVAGVDTLGEGDEVGGDAPAIDGEPLAAPTEAGHHLVGDHHDAVLVAQRPDPGEVAVGGTRIPFVPTTVSSTMAAIVCPPSTMITSARWARARSHSSASSAAWNADR